MCPQKTILRTFYLIINYIFTYKIIIIGIFYCLNVACDVTFVEKTC